MRAFVYTRQSLDRNGTGAAVERQREDCQKLCAERGWTIVREFTDNDVSASSSKPRPAYVAMLAAVERGECEVICSWAIDRLTRKLTELETLIDVTARTGVRIATVSGDLDLSTDAGRLVGRILASVARGEVERKGSRQSRAMQQAAEAGKPSGGPRAFGYEPDLMTVRPGEADLIRAAYADLLAGGSLRAIATDWTNSGVRTVFGNPWSATSVRRMLANPRYSAQRSYRGSIVGKAQWPAIIDQDTWEAAHALLSLPERRVHDVPRVRRYLLPNLARCGVCGDPVRTGRTQHSTRTYRCERMHLSRSAEPVDSYVVAVVLERLSRPDAVGLLTDTNAPDLAVYRERSQAIRERLDDLATALADGLLTLGAVRKSSDRLRSELARCEAELAALSRGDVLAPLVNSADPAVIWSALDLDRKRSVIDTLMVIVLDSPGRGRSVFDPDTVRIEWRAAEGGKPDD
jgi:site-specific DNA recombinase